MTLAKTILHEYVHSASGQGLIIGDRTTTGYQNLVVGGKPVPLLDQLNALDVARQGVKTSLIPMFNQVYTDSGYMESGTSVRVEGGYLFEILGFGVITHQPAKAK